MLRVGEAMLRVDNVVLRVCVSRNNSISVIKTLFELGVIVKLYINIFALINACAIQR